jgi:hypothetical protein
VLGQLTAQLCQFDAHNDQQNASREPGLDVSALSQSVLARYASTLPPSPELPR